MTGRDAPVTQIETVRTSDGSLTQIQFFRASGTASFVNVSASRMSALLVALTAAFGTDATAGVRGAAREDDHNVVRLDGKTARPGEAALSFTLKNGSEVTYTLDQADLLDIIKTVL